MHQPSAEPRRSLYFGYQVHGAWLPSDHPAQQRQRVVIAGAGPAGLVTALLLARLGVASVVLAAERQVSEGSRAIVFTRRTLEILQQAGVADAITAQGLPWRCGSSFYRGAEVFRMEAPHDSDDRFAPMLNLPQPCLEQVLADACAASGLVDLRWGNKLMTFRQAQDGVALQVDTPEGVAMQIDTPEGVYALHTDWLVAADGARSGIRTALGLTLEGTAYETLFVIADIRIDLPYPTERRAYFDPAWNPGNTILMHRQPHGMWRLDYQLPPGESAEQALQPQSMRQRIDAQLAMIGHAGVPWLMDWCSVYAARTLTLADYQHGRVLFVGDAAHLLPIFGVRGANTAFQDTQALAWQLAALVQGLAGPQLLANYSAERVGAAREIIAEAGKSTRFMAPPSRGFRLLRDAVLSLSLTQHFVRPLYHWRTSRPHAYTRSVLNCADDDDALFSSGPGHGAPPCNVRLGEHGFLLDHLGPAFVLLLFGGACTVPADVLQVVRTARARGVPLRLLAIGALQPVAGADATPADVDGKLASVEGKLADVDGTLADADGHACRCWGMPEAGGASLLRPDQHVCARWLRLDGPRLQAALDAALPREGARP